jgi:hypothetical protein
MYAEVIEAHALSAAAIMAAVFGWSMARTSVSMIDYTE